MHADAKRRRKKCGKRTGIRIRTVLRVTSMPNGRWRLVAVHKWSVHGHVGEKAACLRLVCHRTHTAREDGAHSER